MSYHIEASFKRDGQVIDCSQWEVLGGAFGTEYKTIEEAIEVCDGLQNDVFVYGLDETTECSVYDSSGRQVYCSRIDASKEYI